MTIYVVRAGDSVDSIAGQTNTSAGSIIYNNQLVYPYRLAVGQALLLGEQEDIISGKRVIVSNGYAYPFISSWVLTQTLPYLSELSIFSYGFTKEGELIPPQVDEGLLIEEAWARRTRPIFTLTPLGADGKFSGDLASIAINDMAVQQRLIRNVIYVVQERNYGGVDLDFEYIKSSDREAYAAFVKNVRVTLNQLGYPVSVALAPKKTRDQPGVLYEGMDYRLLGEAANSVLLMTYEWGYAYGTPMAVAPIDQVRQVVQYAVSEIPREKISLGIPNYGYDFALPFIQGTSRARTVGNVEAVQRAIEYGSEIQFDAVAQTPFFRYWQYGIQHEVWFEDARSIRAKLALIEEFGLRGCGIWSIMQLFRANWLLTANLFYIAEEDPGYS